MSNNHRGQGPRIMTPNNIAAQFGITLYSDGQPPSIKSTVNQAGALRMMAIAVKAISTDHGIDLSPERAVSLELAAMTMMLVADALENVQAPAQDQSGPADKPRQYLGPRK